MSDTGSPPLAESAQTDASSAPRRWYQGVGRYQWLVLVIASVGWIFDAYEGQIFNITRGDMLPQILRSAQDVKLYGEVLLGVFLAGGAIGGVLFGMFADRWGRKPVMVATILFYSLFAGLTYFVTDVWQVAVLRFLVAMGVGGEWAVAAALVAEVFPKHARAHASGMFHASSCLGVWTAGLVGLAVAEKWRFAYLVSIVPALLVLWVWSSVKEPETWIAARDHAAAGTGGKLGSLRELFSHRLWGPRAVLGMLLAAVGLGTFWAVSVDGQGLARELLLTNNAQKIAAEHPEFGQKAAKELLVSAGSEDFSAKHPEIAPSLAKDLRKRSLTINSDAKFAYGVIEIIGWAVGMLSFGPLCVRLGRRGTFILFQALSLAVVPLTCYAPATYNQLLWLLPLYGFSTVAIQAGFAIYFPELFPNHLRSTGAGFCFNAGRLLSAVVLVFSGWLKSRIDLHLAITLMNLLFVVGIGVVLLLPETKEQPLPE